MDCFSFLPSEYIKISGGNGTVQFYQTAEACWSSLSPPLIEVPFGKSSNITVNIHLRKLKSLVKIQFVVLQTGLESGIQIIIIKKEIELIVPYNKHDSMGEAVSPPPPLLVRFRFRYCLNIMSWVIARA